MGYISYPPAVFSNYLKFTIDILMNRHRLFYLYQEDELISINKNHNKHIANYSYCKLFQVSLATH